jgi:hypothetical protein
LRRALSYGVGIGKYDAEVYERANDPGVQLRTHLIEL